MGNGSIKDSTSANIPSRSRASSESSSNVTTPTSIDTTKDQAKVKVINNGPIYLLNLRRDIIGGNLKIQERTIVENADNSQTQAGKISHRCFPSLVLNYIHGNTDSKMSAYVLNEIAKYEKRDDLISNNFLPDIANKIIYDINKAPKDLIVEEYINNILEITKISPTISSVLKKSELSQKLVKRIVATKYGYRVNELANLASSSEQITDKKIKEFIQAFTLDQNNSKIDKGVKKVRAWFDQAEKNFPEVKKQLVHDELLIDNKKNKLYDKNDNLISALQELDRQIRELNDLKKQQTSFKKKLDITFKEQQIRSTLSKMNRIQKESLHKVNDIDKIARDYFKKNKKGNITNIAIDQNDKLEAPRERYLLDAGFKYIEELVNEIDNQATPDYTSATKILLEKVQNHVKNTAKTGFVDAVFLASIDSATKKLKEKFEEDSTTDITELRQIIDDTLKQTSSKFKSLKVSKEIDFYITKSVETSNISSDNNLIDKLLQENPKDLHKIIYNKLLDSSIVERISLVKTMIEKKAIYTKNKNQLEKVIRATVKTIQFLTAEQIENTTDKELFLDAILNLKTLVAECKKHKVAIEIDDNIAKSMLGKLDEYLTDNDMPDTDDIITIYNLFDPKDQAMSAFFFKNNEALLKNVRQSINDSIARCLIDLTDTTKSEKQFDRFNHLRDMLEQLNKKHINIEVKDKKLMQSIVQYYSDITDLIKEKPANFDLLFKFNEEIKKDYNNNTLKDMLTRSLFNTKIDKKLKAKILEKVDNICNTATSINNSIKESVTVDNKCNTINTNESKFKDLITDNYELQQQVFNSTSKETIVDLNNKIQQNNASLKILTREIINGRSEIMKLADNTKITVFEEYELLFYPIAITVENGKDVTQNYLDNSNAELDSRACTAVLIQLLNDDAKRAMHKKLSMGSTIIPEYQTTVTNKSLFSGVQEHMNNIVNKDNYDFTTAHYVLMQTIKDDRLTKYKSTNYVDFITTTFTEKLAETYQQINNRTELPQTMLNSLDKQALSEIIGSSKIQDNQQLKGKAKVASTTTVAASGADTVLQHKKPPAKRPTTPPPPPPPPTDTTATVAKPVPPTDQPSPLAVASRKNTTITIYQADGETKDDDATNRAQNMLQGVLNDGNLWVASDKDRNEPKNNFQDIMGNDIDEIAQDQLIAYQYDGTTHLTSLTSLMESLNQYNKFVHNDPKGDTPVTVFALNKDNNQVICQTPTTITLGKCPKGTMSVQYIKGKVDNHDCDGVFEIEYNIPKGKQGQEHPSPGVAYNFSGNPRTCYVPASDKGVKVLIMQMQAWENRLTFDVGTSTTLGRKDQVVWNFHQKTKSLGHRLEDDSKYLDTAVAELYKSNITQDSIKEMDFSNKKRDTNYGMKIKMDDKTFKAITQYQNEHK